MTATRRLAAILAADVSGYSRLLESDKPKITIAKVPPAYFVALGAVALFGVASAWWVWRFVSVKLAAVYTEGFRKLGMPEH
jgi:hypothetical protein